MNDPIKFSPSQLVSSTQMVRSLSQQLDKATKEPLFIQRDQKVEWVLLSLDEYRNLLRLTTTNYELQNKLDKNTHEYEMKRLKMENDLKNKYGLDK